DIEFFALVWLLHHLKKVFDYCKFKPVLQVNCRVVLVIPSFLRHFDSSGRKLTEIVTPARVSEPMGSLSLFRQTPKGLMPNLTKGFSALILCESSSTNLSTLCLLHSLMSLNLDFPYWA